jgi:hypothetical protein
VRIPTTTVTAGSSICVVSSPSTKGPSSQIEATAIAGMVSPMLAGRAERQVETGLDSVSTCSPCVFFGFPDVAGGCQRKEEVSVPTRLRQDEHCVQRE